MILLAISGKGACGDMPRCLPAMDLKVRHHSDGLDSCSTQRAQNHNLKDMGSQLIR